MDENNNFPFPQANDLNKVLDIVNITNPINLKNTEYVSTLLNVTAGRTVNYYISACQYLGILDTEKSFTETGRYLRSLSTIEQKIELARLITADPIMGTVYFSEVLYGYVYSTEQIAEIMKRFINYPSEPMYLRRSQCAKAWIAWIFENFK